MANNGRDNPSKGHVMFVGDFEYLIGESGCLFRAPASSPLDIHGYRMGARFECMPRPIETFKKYIVIIHGT